MPSAVHLLNYGAWCTFTSNDTWVYPYTNYCVYTVIELLATPYRCILSVALAPFLNAPTTPWPFHGALNTVSTVATGILSVDLCFIIFYFPLPRFLALFVSPQVLLYMITVMGKLMFVLFFSLLLLLLATALCVIFVLYFFRRKKGKKMNERFIFLNINGLKFSFLFLNSRFDASNLFYVTMPISCYLNMYWFSRTWLSGWFVWLSFSEVPVFLV